MEEKNIRDNDRENELVQHLATKREFLIGERFTVTDVWRSKMERESMVDDFDF